ncbi:hypothetical protein Ciccas_006576 [Cichlidogyrus casuarinus]|uniref:Uncharacterized protein n=1 Tax=Cichlidogyrus casuarinus TaxID=1844966 RepID=A0ABD2Q5D5_9PLAT
MQATTTASMTSEAISASQSAPFPIHAGYPQSRMTNSYGYENSSETDFSTPYHGMDSPSFSNSNQKRPMSSPCPETLAKRSKRPSSVLGIEKNDKPIDSSLFQAILSTDEIDVTTAESIQNAPTSNATQSTESPIDKPSSVPHPADAEDSIASLFLENSNFLDDLKNYTSELCPIECLVLVERCRPFNSDTIFMSYFREQYLDPILT